MSTGLKRLNSVLRKLLKHAVLHWTGWCETYIVNHLHNSKKRQFGD